MPEDLNKLTEGVIGAAIEVHRELGSGLLESAYQRALEHELSLCGLSFEPQKTCSVSYKGVVLDEAYRLDLVIARELIVEI